MQTADRPMNSLLSDLAVKASTLFRQEIQLAKLEAGERAHQASTAAATIIAGAVLGLGALIVLLQALVIAITNAGVPAAWSSVIVGGVVAVIAFALVKKGSSDLNARNLAPRRTAHAVRTDAQTLKEELR